MSDRVIQYTGSIPLVDDILRTNKYAMVGLGAFAKALLGTSTWFDGLACTPTGPASMQVLVNPGSVYAFGNVDGTAYGDLGSDTVDQIVKQGIILSTTTLSCPAPATTGFSVDYLIQAIFQDQDTDSTVLPYFNASNPAVAYNGPANLGTSQNTTRKGACVLSLKTGTAATTGTQTTPAPDSGNTGLWVVTVANGATSITSGNITPYSGSTSATGSSAAWSGPLMLEKLNDKISIATGDLRYMPIGGGSSRTRLTNDTTFYVATTGNDTTGNGTSGTPWATLQKAYNYIVSNIDIAGFNCYISAAAGTYTAGLAAYIPSVGGIITVKGDITTPTNVEISTTGHCFDVGNGISINIEGFYLLSSAGYGINAASNSTVNVNGNMNYGACVDHIVPQTQAVINLNASYTISGGGNAHISSSNGTVNFGTLTVTLTGTPAFSGSYGFIYLQTNSTVICYAATFTGAATGPRYQALYSSVIFTNSGGPTFLPGSTSGSVDATSAYA